MKLGYRLAELLFPSRCILCGALLGKEETDLCRTCRTEVSGYQRQGRRVANIDCLTAVWYYEDNVRQSLLRYKFYNVRSYARPFGRAVAMRAMQDLEQPDLVTWVPVSRLRRLRRGYDQVELLAKAVGEETGLPVRRTLCKIRHTRPQSGLKHAAERRANVLGAYRCVDPEQFRGKRILLLDDILTTGATASECARMLMTAGADKVLFAAVAAGRNHNE